MAYNFLCGGNKNQICGGSDAITVYKRNTVPKRDHGGLAEAVGSVITLAGRLVKFRQEALDPERAS